VKTIRVVIDAKLLRACDQAAKKTKLNRSELVQLALREHLEGARILEFEQRDQRGYEVMPQSPRDRGIRLGSGSGMAGRA
jgi:metal-responsive CopG/Arc/MetJ family transcriptional regulator